MRDKADIQSQGRHVSFWTRTGHGTSIQALRQRSEDDEVPLQSITFVGQTIHREGAETFVYVVSGRGIATSGGRDIALRGGDLVYFADREPHSLQAATDSEFRFLQLNAPGTFKTIWADERNASTWVETGFDIEGRRPLGELRERWAYNWMGA